MHLFFEKFPKPAHRFRMPLPIPDATLRVLERTATHAASKAHAPYSKFPVGAAVLSKSGAIYPGCNVENASYGLCNCAERTAVFSAIAAGETRIEAVVVYTPTSTATAPCGACRQVLSEFGPEALVISICDSPDRIESTVNALLPHAFTL